jgi:curli biogenesis system outer membrane secretion channel CsgG
MLRRSYVRMSFALALSLGAGAFVGCASSKESAQADTLTANVGQYPPAPSGVDKPRVGVPPFEVKTAGGAFGGGGKKEMNDIAADQMTTLLDQSDRFQVIERAQLEKLLNEQNLEGIVKPGELAKTGQVRGVDYLLLGKVTNLRVKSENKQSGLGLAKVGGLINAGGFDYKKKDVTITTEAGVDIRLVDPTTGAILTSNFSEYKKTDSANAIGVDILGASASSDADIKIDEDDKGKILRLALDDALRKSLPKIDRFLKNQKKGSTGATATPAQPAAPAAPVQSALPAQTAQPAAAKKFCSECGKEVAVGTKFCPHCGKKTE